MRRAAKRDANENAIIDALLAAGHKVQVLSQGGGVPDLLVRTPRDTWVLIEVKDIHGSLTPAQVRWIGYYGGVCVVHTPEEALRATEGRGCV